MKVLLVASRIVSPNQTAHRMNKNSSKSSHLADDSLLPQKKHLPSWLSLTVLTIGVIGLAIPVYMLSSAYFDVPEPAEETIPLVDSRMETLPEEAVYPTTDELQAEAIELSEELRKNFPKSASAFHIAANLSAQLNQFEAAEKFWKRSIELNADFVGPQAGLAMALLEQGRESEAISILEEAAARGLQSVDIFQLWTQACQRAGDNEKALQVCQQGLERYPNDVELLLELGKLELQANNLDAARQTFEKVIQLEPKTASAYQSLATVLARLGKEDLSTENRKRYETLRDESSLKDVEFNDLYRASLQRIVSESLINAATEYRRQDQLDIAERLLLRALTLNPKNLSACKDLVSIFRGQSRIADAYEVQKRIVDLQPSAASLVNVASLAIPLQRFDVAEAALLAAVDLEPMNPEARRGLVILYQSTERLEMAETQALELVKIDGSANNYELLAQVRLVRGDQQGYADALAKARNSGM